ncbi:transmembrane 220 family protein [Reichenbachiella sp. MALMAid0571]|uniref:transmembrane 220 family protein n=1 Tax=Reichenbachiella sp. MALMAid0571 TaxID=3143939 RepID=UPI0032E00119
MKIINIFFAILFLLFVGVQYNDPDPLLWMFIYGVAAALFILAVMNIRPKKVILGVIVVGALYSLTYIPGVYDWFTIGQPGEIVASMKVDKMYVEESREFFGLWIALGALIFLYKKS